MVHVGRKSTRWSARGLLGGRRQLGKREAGWLLSWRTPHALSREEALDVLDTWPPDRFSLGAELAPGLVVNQSRLSCPPALEGLH